jgi:hypothetical protein
VNEVFSQQDADLYLEFMTRVGQWRQKTSETNQANILAQYTSFNAMVRDLVKQGQI